MITFIKKWMFFVKILAWTPVIFVIKGIITDNPSLFVVSLVYLLTGITLVIVADRFIKDRLGL